MKVVPLRTLLDVAHCAPPSTLRMRRPGAASDLSAEERDAVLADVAAGKHVRVLVDAVTYIQRDTPNRNFVRFRKGILGRLAKSFVGMPVLRDHDQHNSLARGGTILESTLIEHEGSPAFAQVLELTSPEFVALAVRGLIDRFSIGWATTGDYTCSVCKKNLLTSECPHYPGESVETKNGAQVCEAIVEEADGVEVSVVSVPAVTGTQVQDIRAALAAARGSSFATHGDTMLKLPVTLLSALGLAEDAGADHAETAIQALKATSEANAKAAADARTEVGALREQLTAGERAKLAVEVEKLIDEASRKVGQVVDPATGQRVETKLTASIRNVAEKLGIDAAKEIIAALPDVIPTQLRSIPAPPSGPASPASLTEDELKILRQTGVKVDDYLREKARLSGAA